MILKKTYCSACFNLLIIVHAEFRWGIIYSSTEPQWQKESDRTGEHVERRVENVSDLYLCKHGENKRKNIQNERRRRKSSGLTREYNLSGNLSGSFQ